MGKDKVRQDFKSLQIIAKTDESKRSDFLPSSHHSIVKESKTQGFIFSNFNS